ncbi:MAG TPA: TIGR02206 family membrane protein [Terracidiphilus sp.]|nr:TIGR02206 family membrane protein [Terracidiphilus sp.]
MLSNFHLFGPTHLAILTSVVILGAILAAIQRRLATGSSWLRFTLAWAILIDTVIWYAWMVAHGEHIFPSKLPLELCDASLGLAIIALFTLSPVIFDLVYYTSAAGTSMALLTPNLWEPFPSFGTVQFFVAHGLTLSAVLFLLWSGQARPRRGSPFRAMIFVNCWAAIAGTFDWLLKTDFMYLRAKPQDASLLDLLGPWPWYIFSAEAVAFFLFLLLYLPFRKPLDGMHGQQPKQK